MDDVFGADASIVIVGARAEALGRRLPHDYSVHYGTEMNNPRAAPTPTEQSQCKAVQHSTAQHSAAAT